MELYKFCSVIGERNHRKRKREREREREREKEREREREPGFGRKAFRYKIDTVGTLNKNIEVKSTVYALYLVQLDSLQDYEDLKH